MALQCTNWILIERFKKERNQYEEYTFKITKEKVLFAKSKIDDIDLKMLNLIYKLKICTSTQLSKIIYKNNKFANRYTNNKLKKLFTLGCIDRFFPAKEKGSSPAHVVLAPIGAKILDIKGFRKTMFLNQKWKHTVYLNDILVHLLSNYKVKSCKFEMWLEQSNDFKIRPDMFCVWSKDHKIQYSLFELDMGTEPIKDIVSKIKTYHKYFNSNNFKKAEWQPHKDFAIIPKISFVFTDEKRFKTINKFIENFESNVKFESVSFNNLNF